MLQYVIQTYLCAYLTERDALRDLAKDYWYAFFVALAMWLMCIGLASAFGERMRNRPGLHLPLYLFFMIAQMSAFVLAGINFLPKKASIIFSAMQACCCLALSLYTCCLKSKFTVVWSHVCFGILLTCALGTAIAVYTDSFIYYIAGAGTVAIWASIVTNNLMAIHDKLCKTDGFYAAMRSQADWSILFRWKCKNHNKCDDPTDIGNSATADERIPEKVGPTDLSNTSAKPLNAPIDLEMQRS